MAAQQSEILEVGKIGFRYRTDFVRPDERTVTAYRELMNKTGCLTGNVGDCVGRGAAMNSRIKCLASGMKIVGPALTVKTAPADNLMIHKALTIAKAGDVLVIDGGGDISWALLGFLMASAAMKIGMAGVVVDGAVRDAEEIRRAKFPVFACGLSPNGPFKEGPGEVNFPIQCGGQIVNPGDIIVADDDGVVVVGRDDAPNVIGQVEALVEREANRLAEIESGLVTRPGLDEILSRKGLK